MKRFIDVMPSVTEEMLAHFEKNKKILDYYYCLIHDTSAINKLAKWIKYFTIVLALVAVVGIVKAIVS